MTTVAILAILAAFGLLAYSNFRRALTFLFALLPTYLIRFSLGPVPTTLLEGFVLILVAMWLVRRLTIPPSHRPPIALGMLRVPLVLGLAAACFAAAVAPDVFAALGILKAYYVEPALVLLMCVSTFSHKDDWADAFAALCASGVVVSLIGIAQYVTGLGIPSPWNVERRVTSVFDFPNAVGLFLAPILSALIVVAISYRRALPVRMRVCAILAAALMAVAIVLAQTEAAIIAVPAALVVTFLFSRAPRTAKAAVVAAALALAILPTVLLPVIRKKIFLGDVSGQARLAMWHETLRFLAEHPLVGAGLSGFPTAIAPYHDATFYEIFQYPHTLLLNIWVELGLLGVIVLAIVSVQIVRIAVRHRTDAAVLAAFAALVTMAVHGLVDVPFFKNDLAMLTVGFLAALIAFSTPSSFTARTSGAS